MSATPEAAEGRLVTAALRCYPARWRRRHADEAAELAALLIADGTPAASIAWSYLAGAAREWLVPRRPRSLSEASEASAAADCRPGGAVSPPRPQAGRAQRGLGTEGNTGRPWRGGRRLAAALLAAACLIGFSVALAAEGAPAKAAGTTQAPASPGAGSHSPHRLNPCRPAQATAHVRTC
ncbi:MAG: hypothetical protein JO345_20040 [Streptosporangiaceae bacterium]|nr:hypothetical protein [Streptosporangiaceae bacterium]